MDTYDDIFSEIEPLFDGDEWDHRKMSTDQIHKADDKQSIPMTDQDEQKEVVHDAQKIATEESDKEVKKSDTDLKIDVDRFIVIDQKYHKEISDDDDVDEQKEVVPDGQKIAIEESDKEVKKDDIDQKTDVD
ncbi:hypothetical protein HAX54_019390 [Datura stramonium]|uniref:Uncharacterized protein n=1 Tax=Datura stramonium TaxID=4076 RepID=A0ABS8URB4_DATST|nr:hypothetical protein [Datura stramonium]